MTHLQALSGICTAVRDACHIDVLHAQSELAEKDAIDTGMATFEGKVLRGGFYHATYAASQIRSEGYS